MRALGVFILGVFFFLGILYSGFVFSTLWGWFIAPLGVPTLSIPQALGLLLVVGYPLLGIYSRLEAIKPLEFTMEKFTQRLVASYITITLVWGMGAIYTLFI